MKHRCLTLFLLFLLALSAWAAAVGAGDTIDVQYFDEEALTYGPAVRTAVIPLILDGAPLEGPVAAFTRQYSSNYGRTLLPLRMVSEALNAQVMSDGARQVILTRGDTVIVLTRGAGTALVNGQTVPLPDGIPACLVRINGLDTTMVPARFVAEHLGAAVSWDDAAKCAVITTGSAVSPTPTPPPVSNKGDLGYVKRIQCDDNAQSLYIVTDYLPEYTVAQTGQKVVIDLLGANLSADFPDGSIAVENDLIRAVRYAQHDGDLGNGYAHTVRVVLDLRAGITLKQNLTLRREQGGVRIDTALLPEQKPVVTDPSAPAKPGQRTVVLDAGHGGGASGAVYEGIMEKDLTLPMTLKLYQILADRGYRVILTRSEDKSVDLYERAAIANAAQADVFVSIHCNATTVSSTYEGLYTYFYPGSAKGQALANRVQSAAAAAAGAVDRGLMSNNFVVLRETKMPAILVETGFMTSHGELMRLADPAYQQKMAQGIADGIIRYLEN